MSHRQLTHKSHSVGAGEPWFPRRHLGWMSQCRSAWAAVLGAVRRHRSRRYIGELDARTLKDIGITFAEAECEANKPF